ncbi:MAG: hypothetical protein ACRER8_22310 [Pseudomonas sp.]|uniref:hypothetical protein n=1 Tax=Pseudomonas sp. TaxID=306 RepID=UPI003D6E5AAA
MIDSWDEHRTAGAESNTLAQDMKTESEDIPIEFIRLPEVKRLTDLSTATI